MKTLYILVLLMFCSCSTNNPLIYSWQNGSESEETTHISETYFYADSTVALYILERQNDKNFSKISIHYPYYYRISGDTLIITATDYTNKNSALVKRDSTFEIERFKVKRNKLLRLPDIHQIQSVGYQIDQSNSVLKKMLYTHIETDSMDWRMYCYNCDTLILSKPIQYGIEEIGNKKILEELFH